MNIVTKLYSKKNKIEDILCFLKKEKKEVVLYGAGYCGYETLNLMKQHKISISAICDDGRIGEYLDETQITAIEDININANIVIFITSGFNKEMKKKLERLRLLKFFIDIDFGRYDAEKENFEYFFNHKAELNLAYDLMADDYSRQVFLNLCNYRISRDLKFLSGTQEENQYFPIEKGLDLRNNNDGSHVFLDLGAFNGDSINGFLKYINNKYCRIIAVEASKKNYNALIKNTMDIENIEYHNIGVYKEKTKLNFVISDAKNTFVSEDGENEIDVDSVDHIVKDQPVTFIKMDIEGAEYDAVLGSKDIIKKNKPIMAISVYHKVEDLYRILLLIHEIEGEYEYYLRHYSPTVIETILYAVPKKVGFNEK